MTRPRLIIHLAVAGLLLFAGPAALASPGNGHGKCAHGEEHPGNGNKSKCPEDGSTSSGSEGSESSPSPSPSPSASPEPSSTESPENEHPHGGPPGHNNGGNRPNNGNSPQPQPSPSPSESPTAQPGQVLVAVSVDKSMASVGDTLTYTLTLRNPGTSAVSPTVTSTVPDEVQFLSATAQPAPVYGSDSLTWSTDLAPGAVRTLTWQGRVTSGGDLDAVNVVTAPGTTTPTVETHTYLAEVQGVVLHRSPGEPDWGTHQERQVISSTGPSRAAATAAPAASESSGALPYTGAPIIPLLFGGALLVLGGCMLAANRTRRLSAVALLVVVVAAACTSDAPPRDQTSRSDEQSDEGDEVLGTRVGRGDDNGNNQNGNENGTDPGQGSDDGASDPETGNDGDAPADEPAVIDEADDDVPVAAPPPEPAPEEEPTREVVLTEVPNEPPAPRALGPSGADNEIFLDWDAASRSIIGASSRAIFRADSPIQFLTSLDEGNGSVIAEVTLTNVTDAERLLVSGHFVLTVTGSEGTFRLSSPSLEQVLDPDDEVSASYEFALPSGNYEIVASYVTG